MKRVNSTNRVTCFNDWQESQKVIALLEQPHASGSWHHTRLGFETDMPFAATNADLGGDPIAISEEAK